MKNDTETLLLQLADCIVRKRQLEQELALIENAENQLLLQVKDIAQAKAQNLQAEIKPEDLENLANESSSE